MKIKETFRIREIAGEYIIVNQGAAGADMTKIISLNSSARLLFESLAGKDFTVEDAAGVLMEHYGIDDELASADAAKWAGSLIEAGVIA